MRDTFESLAGRISAGLQPGEDYRAYLEAEHSDFVRLNRARVRQAGTVSQSRLTLDLARGARHAEATLTLSGDPAADTRLLENTLHRLRAILPSLPEDPYLARNPTPAESVDTQPGDPPEPQEMLQAVTRAARGLDLVGHWAAGRIYRGFAGSTGQRHWFEADGFSFDWSLYYRADKAVKGRYAGRQWDAAELVRRIDSTAGQLPIMAAPPRNLRPGRFRAYLAPAALAEILTLVTWNGFSLRALRTRQTPLLRLTDGTVSLHPSVSLAEHAAGGHAPRFTVEGFPLPERVSLVRQGRFVSGLADPRSSREYGVEVSSPTERPESLEMDPGVESVASAAERLGEGLLLSDLWYTNLSDLAHCGVTGMTRYACLWVEQGRPVAPLEPMRFDVSLYHLLGDGLLGITREREWLADNSTYGQRSTGGMLLPGILVRDLPLTL